MERFRDLLVTVVFLAVCYCGEVLAEGFAVYMDRDLGRSVVTAIFVAAS